jgi:hypothetical protein
VQIYQLFVSMSLFLFYCLSNLKLSLFSCRVVGGFRCGWAKLNVVFLCRQVWWQNTSFNFAKRWHMSFVFLFVYCRSCRSFRVSANVLALGEEADFEALNCLPALNLIRSTKLHTRTETAFLPNACYSQWFLLCFPFSQSSIN